MRCCDWLNRTTKDWHIAAVTLSKAKGLKLRCFAALSMTFLWGDIVKCTNVVWFDLAFSDQLSAISSRGKGGGCPILSSSPIPLGFLSASPNAKC